MMQRKLSHKPILIQCTFARLGYRFDFQLIVILNLHFAHMLHHFYSQHLNIKIQQICSDSGAQLAVF